MDMVFELHLTRDEAKAVCAALEQMADDMERNRRVMAETVTDAADDAVSTAIKKAALLLACIDAQYKLNEAQDKYRAAVYCDGGDMPF